MSNAKRFILAILISLILHILFGVSLSLLPTSTTSGDNMSAIEVFLQRRDGGWQLADVLSPLNEEKPDNARFLGLANQKVKEEIVATKPQDRRAGKSQTPKKENLYNFDKQLFAMKSPVIKNEGTAIENGAPFGSQATIPEDFYPDIKYGDHTYVNVLRYPEVEYFIRLKRILKMTWNPASALRRDMQLTAVSRGVVSVVVAVSVDKLGDLSELFVLRSSGLSNYDDEALRAVRASSPFSSPPEKFVEDDGALRMAWTFFMYL